MTAANTKEAKIDRILRRQGAANETLNDIRDQAVATIAMLTGVVESLEDENKRLRKYLGSVLFQRREAQVAAERQEPRWGNTRAGNPLPHTDAL